MTCNDDLNARAAALVSLVPFMYAFQTGKCQAGWAYAATSHRQEYGQQEWNPAEDLNHFAEVLNSDAAQGAVGYMTLLDLAARAMLGDEDTPAAPAAALEALLDAVEEKK